MGYWGKGVLIRLGIWGCTSALLLGVVGFVGGGKQGGILLAMVPVCQVLVGALVGQVLVGTGMGQCNGIK